LRSGAVVVLQNPIRWINLFNFFPRAAAVLVGGGQLVWENAGWWDISYRCVINGKMISRLCNQEGCIGMNGVMGYIVYVCGRWRWDDQPSVCTGWSVGIVMSGVVGYIVYVCDIWQDDQPWDEQKVCTGWSAGIGMSQQDAVPVLSLNTY